MLIAAFFPSSPSRFHPWAACGDLQGNQNERRRTSSQRQILVSLDCAREDCSGSLWHENRRWIQVFINSHILQTKIGLLRTKTLIEMSWLDCNPPAPPPPKKKIVLFVEGNERIKQTNREGEILLPEWVVHNKILAPAGCNLSDESTNE